MSILGKLAKEGLELAVKKTAKTEAKKGAELAVERAAKTEAKKGAELAVERTAAKVARKGAASKKVPAAVADARPSTGLRGANSPLAISTRRPKNAKSFAVHGNPDEEMLVQTGDAMRAEPGQWSKALDKLTDEPFMADMKGASPDRVHDVAVRRGADNLHFIANEFMEPEQVENAAGWYPTAHRVANDMAVRHGFEPQAAYGTIAVLSPQTEWNTNLAKAERLMGMHRDNFDYGGAGGLQQVARYINERMVRRPDQQGAIAPLGEAFAARLLNTPMKDIEDPFERYAKVVLTDAARNNPKVPVLSPSGEWSEGSSPITWGSSVEVGKALRILDDPSMASIARQMDGGGKVPSFYDDIAAPYSADPTATIDTHSSGAFSLFPAGASDPISELSMGLGNAPKSAITGAKGVYGLNSDSHGLFAKEMGLPHRRNAQSVGWEGVRGMWGYQKPAALKAAVKELWLRSSSPDEARYGVAELLGRPVRRVYGR